jgi:hypothetical protein
MKVCQPMSTRFQLEKRVADLEAEIARLKSSNQEPGSFRRFQTHMW